MNNSWIGGIILVILCIQKLIKKYCFCLMVWWCHKGQQKLYNFTFKSEPYHFHLRHILFGSYKEKFRFKRVEKFAFYMCVLYFDTDMDLETITQTISINFSQLKRERMHNSTTTETYNGMSYWIWQKCKQRNYQNKKPQ